MHDFVTFMAGYIAGLIAMIILDVIFRYAIESFKVNKTSAEDLREQLREDSGPTSRLDRISREP